jgi:hypothetical protein
LQRDLNQATQSQQHAEQATSQSRQIEQDYDEVRRQKTYTHTHTHRVPLWPWGSPATNSRPVPVRRRATPAQIVALLEAEIAHLRAQLRASPDQKDMQLIHLRRRVLVLGVQLNKAIKSRRCLETAFSRVRDFSNVWQRAL